MCFDRPTQTSLNRVSRCVAGLYVSCALLMGAGCKPADSPRSKKAPVVYCSVDESFAREILDVFTKRTGIEVSVVFDSEAGKTTGLVNRMVSEAAVGRPRADVFWSGELFQTMQLARKGLLLPYDSPEAADIPARYKDSQHHWTAMAVRGRVLAYDPSRTSASDVPLRWESLADGPFAARTAIANPLFGTTCGHVAAMFALWGKDRARSFLTRLRDGGATIADSNSATVRAVIAGRVDFAATDTDDVWVANRGGAGLTLVYPDLGDGGTLLIPCSVALIKGTQNVDSARRLVDFLVSAEVERLLAMSDSRNIPVRDALRRELDIQWPGESKVSFDAIADAMPEAIAAIREILIR